MDEIKNWLHLIIKRNQLDLQSLHHVNNKSELDSAEVAKPRVWPAVNRPIKLIELTLSECILVWELQNI